MRSIRPLVVAACIGLAACASEPGEQASARAPLEEDLHLPRLVVLERPPIIAVQEMAEMPLAIRRAESAEPAELIRREGARRVRVDALPFLTQTEMGRRFLAARPPRALARGMPPEICPAVAAAEGPPGAGRGAVARRALEACLARLGPERDGCGCRVIALDDALTVAREDVAYATGVSARLQVPGLGLDLMLVAEDMPAEAPGGAGTLLLRDLRGPVARLVRGPGEAVTVALTRSGRRFEGFRIPVGFRRGRLAERIYATDAEGNRLRLLVGFEPAELAGRAAAWLAWPERGSG